MAQLAERPTSRCLRVLHLAVGHPSRTAKLVSSRSMRNSRPSSTECDRIRQQETITDLFGLLLKTIPKCTVCGQETSIPEKMHSLIVSCDGVGDLNAAIIDYFKSEERPGIECDSDVCKDARATKKYSKIIARGPDILCIQFNRFEAVGARTKKNSRRIPFDEYLDLSPYVQNSASLRYRLLATVQHIGSLHNGHYISVARTAQGDWQLQNDKESTKANLKHATSPTGAFAPYLLFWKKLPAEGIEVPLSSKQQRPPSNPKKRPHDDQGTPAPAEAEGRRSKSPKIHETPVSNHPNPSQSKSGTPLPWPLNTLYGASGIFGHAQGTEQALSECKKEHERKDQKIQSQKILIRRAAISHMQLTGTVTRLKSALRELLQATDTVTPLMRDLQARGGKHRDKATGYLGSEGRAKVLRTKGMGRYLADEHMVRLLDGLPEENGALKTFTEGAEQAIRQDGLEEWLTEELRKSGLPKGDWEGLIRRDL
ncbi:MAG: hypothetical protein Q9170_000789 [Blastenia crenularia]